MGRGKHWDDGLEDWNLKIRPRERIMNLGEVAVRTSVCACVGGPVECLIKCRRVEAVREM